MRAVLALRIPAGEQGSQSSRGEFVHDQPIGGHQSPPASDGGREQRAHVICLESA